MGLEQCVDVNDAGLMANILYPYCPNQGAAVLFSVIFGVVCVGHVVQAIMHRKKYCWVIAMAAAWEAAGFATRAAGTKHMDAREATAYSLNVASTVFILIAPIWLNAFVYMTFGRMVLYFLPDRRVFKISARFLTLIFVLLDITAFLVQLGGVTQLTQTDVPQSTIDLGLHIYMFGVGFQEFFILGFVGLSLRFRHKALQWPIFRTERWNTLLYLMWVSLLMITVRILYRIGEYSQGFDGYAATHEWLMYVWDALPMFVAMALFNVYHPATALVGPESEFPKLTRQQKKERKEAKKLAKFDGGESGTTLPDIPKGKAYVQV